MDATYRVCPHCGKVAEEARVFFAFEHHVHSSVVQQIVFFLVGFLGLQLVGLLVTLAVEIGYVSSFPGTDTKGLQEALSQPWANMLINATTYGCIGGILFLLLWRFHKIPELFRSFKNGKAILAGIVGFFAILAAQMLYNAIETGIFNAMGQPVPGVNQNETSIRAISRTYPVLSLLIFGIIGPFCEEVTYRLGLFGFATRLGKILGYLLTAFVFGIIHFDWTALGSGASSDALLTELVNLPSYIGSGAALCFLYDRFGFSASFVAHSINNLFSVLATMSGA